MSLSRLRLFKFSLPPPPPPPLLLDTTKMYRLSLTYSGKPHFSVPVSCTATSTRYIYFINNEVNFLAPVPQIQILISAYFSI